MGRCMDGGDGEGMRIFRSRLVMLGGGLWVSDPEHFLRNGGFWVLIDGRTDSVFEEV